MAGLSAIGTFTCPLLVEKTSDVWKKAQIIDTQGQYTFEVVKTEEIFDFLVKEKFITFLKDHQILNKDELRERLTINTTIHGTILLMHVGVSEISYKTRSIKGYSSSLTKKRLWQLMRILFH